jgi:hypothetical protein
MGMLPALHNYWQVSTVNCCNVATHDVRMCCCVVLQFVYAACFAVGQLHHQPSQVTHSDCCMMHGVVPHILRLTTTTSMALLDDYA